MQVETASLTPCKSTLRTKPSGKLVGLSTTEGLVEKEVLRYMGYNESKACWLADKDLNRARVL